MGALAEARSRSCARRFGPMAGGYNGGSFAGACPGAGGCGAGEGWLGEDGTVVFLPSSPHAPSTRAAPTSIDNTRITVINSVLLPARLQDGGLG